MSFPSASSRRASQCRGGRNAGFALDQFQMQQRRRVFADPVVALVDAGQIRGRLTFRWMNERSGVACFQQVMNGVVAAQENIRTVIGDPRRHRLR